MSPSGPVKPQRISPLELAIFLLVLGVFSHSSYQLFTDFRSVKTQVLTLNSSSPGSGTRTAASPSTDGADRTTASASTGSNDFSQFELNCDSVQPLKAAPGTTRFRLTGGFCGTAGEQAAAPKEVAVRNTTNRIPASVYIDSTHSRFTTDFVPLNPGENTVEVDFKYPGRSDVNKRITVVRDR